MESGWLRCKVLPGMFSQELIVVIEEPGRGEVASFFVDASFVRVAERPRRDHAVDGQLSVLAEPRGDRVTVTLPVETLESGRVISVPAELVAS